MILHMFFDSFVILRGFFVLFPLPSFYFLHHLREKKCSHGEQTEEQMNTLMTKKTGTQRSHLQQHQEEEEENKKMNNINNRKNM